MTSYVNPSTRVGGVKQVVVPERPPANQVDDAPFDDTQYTRVNGEWVPIDFPEIVPDTVAPSPPSGLSADGTVVSSGTAVDYELSWTPPTTNEDTSPLVDFAYYVVRWRYAGSGPWVTFVSNDPTTVLHGLRPAADVEWSVLARDYSGNDSTWASDTITGLADLVGPEQPSIPSLTSRLGTIRATWDGLDYAGDPAPADFDHLEFYVATSGTGPWTYVDRVSGAGSAVITDVAVGDTRYVSTIAFDSSGNSSPRSAAASIVVTGVVVPDIDTSVFDSIDVDIDAARAEAAAASYAANHITETQITDNAISSPKLAAGAVTAEKIAARAITAEKLVLGGLSNLVPNGVGELGGMGGWMDSGWVTYRTDDKPDGLPGAFWCAPGTGSLDSVGLNVAGWDCQWSDEFLVEVWLKADKPDSRIYVELRDQNGQHAAYISDPADASHYAGGTPYPVQNQVVPLGWNRYAAVARARETATRMRIARVWFNHANGTERNAAVGIAVRVRPRNGGSLLVDGSIVAGKIAAGAVIASKIGSGEVIAGKLAANAVQAGNIEAGAVVTNSLAAGAVDAVAIAADAVTADKIAANAIQAEHVSAGSVSVDKLASGSISAGVEVIAGDASANHAKMTHTGFKVFIEDPVDGIPDEVVRMGSDTGDLFGIRGPDGLMRASVSDTGLGAFTGLSVEATSYDASDNPAGGLTIYGTEFLEYLDKRPRGLVTHARTTLTGSWSISDTETPLFEFAFDGDPDREFWFHIDPLIIDVAGSANARVALVARATSGGTTQPTTSSPLMRLAVGSVIGGAPTTLGLDITGQFSSYTRVLVSGVIYAGATSGSVTGNNDVIRAAIYDMGPKQDTAENTFLLRYAGASPPSTKTYTSTWNATNSETYSGSGVPEATDKDMKQGYSSYDGDSHSVVIFGGKAVSGETTKTVASALSGATLKKVEVYLYFNHWYYNSGGTALIRAYNSTSLSSSTPTGTIKSSSSWPKPGGRWVNITSIATTSIRGITIGKAGSTNLLYYGRANGHLQSYKPQLRVTYVR